jgi:transcriptional regulator with XRE-family HTH domain
VIAGGKFAEGVRIDGTAMMDATAKVLTPASCRSARELLKITRAELAGFAGISVSTVRRFEGGEEAVSDYAIGQIVEAFKRAGALFVRPANAAPP